MMKKLLAAVLCLLMLCACALAEEVSATVTLSDEGIKVSGSGVTVEGRKVMFISGGTYEVTGSLSDGRLIVDAENVTLRLVDVTLGCKDNDAITVKKEQSAVIEIPEGTETVLTVTGSADNIKGAIRNRGSLSVTGAGTLTVAGCPAAGIHSSADLSVTGVTLSLRTEGDGIHAKEDVTLTGVSGTIEAGDEGIQCGDDGENIEGDLRLNDCDLRLVTAGDALRTDLGDVMITGSTLRVIGEKNAVETPGTLTLEESTLAAITGKAALNAGAAEPDFTCKLVSPLAEGTAVTLTDGTGNVLLSSDALPWELKRVTVTGTDTAGLTLTRDGTAETLN